MSDDNKNSEPFDFDFDSLNAEESSTASESSFDLDNPFGDDVVISRSETGTEAVSGTSESSFDLDNPFGDDLAASGSEAGVSAGNPYLDDSTADSSVEELAETSGEEVPPVVAGEENKKKGFLGGLFGGKGKGKEKAAAKLKKEKASKQDKAEKTVKPKKEKKEKVVKEKGPAGEPVPRDWGTILCIAFSVFLLVSLLMLNIAAFLSRGPESTMMQTICFLGAFNLVGLVAASVPILFYKFPQERTMPNILLGISVVAMFTGLLMFVTELYRYNFILSP